MQEKKDVVSSKRQKANDKKNISESKKLNSDKQPASPPFPDGEGVPESTDGPPLVCPCVDIAREVAGASQEAVVKAAESGARDGVQVAAEICQQMVSTAAEGGAREGAGQVATEASIEFRQLAQAAQSTVGNAARSGAQDGASSLANEAINKMQRVGEELSESVGQAAQNGARQGVLDALSAEGADTNSRGQRWILVAACCVVVSLISSLSLFLVEDSELLFKICYFVSSIGLGVYAVTYLRWTLAVRDTYFFASQGSHRSDDELSTIARNWTNPIGAPVTVIAVFSVACLILLLAAWPDLDIANTVLEQDCWANDQLFFIYLLFFFTIVFSCTTASTAWWLGAIINDRSFSSRVHNGMAALLAFSTIIPYILPFLVEYIVTHGTEGLRLHMDVRLRGVIICALFLHCLSLVQINRQSRAPILVNVSCSVVVLLYVGVTFGFVYHAEDRRGLPYYNNNFTENRLPGFKDYAQPTSDIFKRAMYRISKEDLRKSLQYALGTPVDTSVFFNAFDWKQGESTVSKLVESVYDVAVESFVIEGKDGFKNKLKHKIQDWIARRGPRQLTSEQSRSGESSEWYRAKIIGYYVIPHDVGRSGINSDFTGIDKPTIRFFGEDSEGSTNQESGSWVFKFFESRAKFLSHLEKTATSHSGLNIQITGMADKTPILQTNGTYSSNYELAKARAERTRSLIKSVIESAPGEAVISIGSISSDYSEKQAPEFLGSKIPFDLLGRMGARDMRASVVALTEIGTFPLEDKYELDPLHYSDAITLTDAMFYSMYTVTTTGYGIIPLSGSIKAFTAFENIFELIIIAVLLGIVIGDRFSGVRPPQRRE